MPCGGKTWLQLFVRMHIIITLFEATFYKSIDTWHIEPRAVLLSVHNIFGDEDGTWQFERI